MLEKGLNNVSSRAERPTLALSGRHLCGPGEREGDLRVELLL